MVKTCKSGPYKLEALYPPPSSFFLTGVKYADLSNSKVHYSMNDRGFCYAACAMRFEGISSEDAAAS